MAVAALALAAAPAIAAEKQHRGHATKHEAGMQHAKAPGASHDNMADQLNAQSLSRAQAGADTPTMGMDSTGNLNRMSEGDAAQGKAMPQPPMPFR